MVLLELVAKYAVATVVAEGKEIIGRMERNSCFLEQLECVPVSKYKLPITFPFILTSVPA